MSVHSDNGPVEDKMDGRSGKSGNLQNRIHGEDNLLTNYRSRRKNMTGRLQYRQLGAGGQRIKFSEYVKQQIIKALRSDPLLFCEIEEITMEPIRDDDMLLGGLNIPVEFTVRARTGHITLPDEDTRTDGAQQT